MANYNTYFCLLVSCMLLFLSFTEASEKGGITLDLIHRDSPLSPYYDPSITHFERLRKVLHRSFARWSALNSNYLRATRIAPTDDFESPLTPTGGEYLMKIQLGTPPVDVVAIADTGSDLTWTQCKPCTQCYEQNDPLFDPSKTSTYRSVSCQSEQCSAVGSASCDSSNDCNYQMSYGDKSYTIGDLAAETLSFGSDSEKSSMSFPNVVFGCGHENAGTFNGSGSGIVGLGGGSLSIIKQLDKSIGGRFSYCLNLYDSKVSSKIKFGTDAIVTGPNVVSTPIVSKSPDTYYYVTLEGISVGNKKFAYQSSSNNKALGEEGNIIVDSGTTLTFLSRDLYNGLETEVVDAINLTRSSETQGVLNLCYEVTNDTQLSPPTIIAHFSGADVEIPQETTFLEIQPGLVCLTFVPSDDMAIFGNLHQLNYHIGYDLHNQKLNFLQTDCSKSE